MENNDKDPINEFENNGEQTPEKIEKENSDAVTVDAFLTSLDEMTKEDAAPPAKKKISFSTVVRTALTAVCLAVFVFAVFMIASNLMEGFSADKIYSDLSNDFFEGVDRTGYMDYLAPAVLDKETPKHGSPRNDSLNGDFTVVETNDPFTQQFKKKLEEYLEKNPDIYGWIQVDGTNISYACVKGTDNDYYLDHTATLEYNINGAIFADFRCDKDVLRNPNLVFYGHNMVYPSQMFNEITKFLDANFFKNNRFITIYTLDGVYRYEIFSVYQTTSTYRYCQLAFTSEESFVKWCEEMKANSIYQVPVSEFSAESRILTLSTCTNGHQDDRYSLQARLVTVEK